MVSMDLSHYLNVQKQTECSGAQSQPDGCQENVTSSRPRFHASLRVSRVHNDKKESTPCLSFRQASTLAIVLFLLSNVLLDATVSCVLIASAASTVSMALELRTETLEKRQQRATLKQSSLELRFAMRELERAESDFVKSLPQSVVEAM